MFVLNNKVLLVGEPFTHDNIMYPANWLYLSSPTEKAAIGITEVVQAPRPDDFYAVIHEDPVNLGQWIVVPYTPEQMKVRLELYSKQARDWRMNSGIEHTIGAETYTVPTDYVTRNQFFSFRIIQERAGSPILTPAALMLGEKEVVLALTEAQLLGVEVKMEARVHDCYAAQLTLQQGIQDETVTTKEQIDLAYAAVP